MSIDDITHLYFIPIVVSPKNSSGRVEDGPAVVLCHNLSGRRERGYRELMQCGHGTVGMLD